MATRTAEEARREFERCGVSITDWARRHDLPHYVVQQVLRGKRKGQRGQAHRAAVLLGIKDGLVVDGEQFDSRLQDGGRLA